MGKLKRKRGWQLEVIKTGWPIGGGAWPLSSFNLFVPPAWVDLLPSAEWRLPPQTRTSVSGLVLPPRGGINTRGNTAPLFTFCIGDFMGHFNSREAEDYSEKCARHYCIRKIFSALALFSILTQNKMTVSYVHCKTAADVVIEISLISEFVPMNTWVRKYVVMVMPRGAQKNFLSCKAYYRSWPHTCIDYQWNFCKVKLPPFVSQFK